MMRFPIYVMQEHIDRYATYELFVVHHVTNRNIIITKMVCINFNL